MSGNIMFFGPNGVYSTATGGLLAGTSSAIGSASGSGLLSGLNFYTTGVYNVSQYSPPIAAPKPSRKSTRSILAKLREEIDVWHGDILERCPA